MGESPKAFQSLGHYASKPVLPRELGDEEDVAWSIDLVGTVGTTYGRTKKNNRVCMSGGRRWSIEEK